MRLTMAGWRQLLRRREAVVDQELDRFLLFFLGNARESFGASAAQGAAFHHAADIERHRIQPVAAMGPDGP